jgi:cold shock protein
MQVGTVKWYDCRKGYGFIVNSDGEDVLAHFSVIEGTGFRRLYDGEHVEFEAARSDRGLNATFVRRLDGDRRKPRTP